MFILAGRHHVESKPTDFKEYLCYFFNRCQSQAERSAAQSLLSLGGFAFS